MTERPILFSAPMVRAILDGSKTQTRRVLPAVFNAPPELIARFAPPGTWRTPNPGADPSATWGVSFAGQYPTALRCTYGIPGDRLWVRETWQAIHVSTDPETGLGDDVKHAARIPSSNEQGWWAPVYAATDPSAREHKDDRGFPWRPAIHMPRWASRITLAVESVRVERLQAITEADARAEGFDPSIGSTGAKTARDWFKILWWAINGSETWDSNAWVWVVTFSRVQP